LADGINLEKEEFEQLINILCKKRFNKFLKSLCFNIFWKSLWNIYVWNSYIKSNYMRILLRLDLWLVKYKAIGNFIYPDINVNLKVAKKWDWII